MGLQEQRDIKMNDGILEGKVPSKQQQTTFETEKFID